MGLFSSSTIGIEISHNGIGCVLTNIQTDRQITLAASAWRALPEGSLRQALREPQVLQPDDFIKVLRETWGSLHSNRRQVALSLPDCTGMLLLESLDSLGKRTADTLEMLRWKLAKRLGFEPDELHLDFQVLEQPKDGPVNLLVAMAALPVIRQYEELFLEAGLQPVTIGLHSMHLLKLFERYPAGEGRMIMRYDSGLSVVLLASGRPLFCRAKNIPEQTGYDQVLQRELLSSLAASARTGATAASGPCFCFTAPTDTTLPKLIASITGAPPVLLSTGMLVSASGNATVPPPDLHCFSAAVGAAVGRV